MLEDTERGMLIWKEIFLDFLKNKENIFDNATKHKFIEKKSV